MKNKLITLLIVWLWPFAAFADAHINAIDLINHQGVTRLILNANGQIRPHLFTLQHPDRFVIDFNKTHLKVSLKSISLANSPFISVRSGHPDSHTLRLVFDLKQPIHYKMIEQSGNKMMVGVYQAQDMPTSNGSLSHIQDKSTTHQFSKIENNSKPHSAPFIVDNRIRPIIVVIDPGHGGKDPGAIGEYGTQEKNVVLKVALQLAEKINHDPNVRVVLTRNGDYFVPLAGRLKLARKGKADLFIAIHADSFYNTHANGASVYALSARGATSVAARWLANRENHSELGGVDLRELEDQSMQLRSVLIDLAQTATNRDSLRLGTSMLDALDQVTNLHYSRVEQAPFMVLKSPDIPSILIEMGFISNPREEEKLRDAQYQHKMMQAIYNGIHFYLRKYSAMQT